MNTRYLFLSVLMLCCFLIGNAQQYVYVQTPAGSSVEGIIIQEEYTASEITTINNTYIYQDIHKLHFLMTRQRNTIAIAMLGIYQQEEQQFVG